MNNNNTGNNTLSERALLVSLTVSQWIGRKLDKKATNTVMKEHKTDSASGGYTKKLLPGAGELAAVTNVAAKARQYFYDNTLPWMSDGTRIISGKNYINFTNEIRKIKSEFEKVVSIFEIAYPSLKIQAEKKLGDLFNDEDYPKYIGNKFDLEVNFLPMPDVKDFRIDVSNAEKKDFERKMKEIEQKAMQDVWSRLHKTIKSASEKLSNPDAIFRDSLLENITELTAILPMLNISDDKELERVTGEVNTLVNSYRSDNLRENKEDRTKAAKELAELERNLSAYCGSK